MADACCYHLDAYFSCAGWVNLNCLYNKRLTILPGYRCTAGYRLAIETAMIEAPPFDFFFVFCCYCSSKVEVCDQGFSKTYRFIIEGIQGMLASSNGHPRLGGGGGSVEYCRSYSEGLS